MQEIAFKRHAKILLAVAGFSWLAAPAVAQTSPAGWWVDQSGKAGIVISACGADLCGKIEWLRVPLDSEGKPKTDIHNGDTALRARPLCGLSILGNFVPDGEGGWKGGWIYDPEGGKTYKSVMHVAADGRLHVRGYVGITLLGRSAIWTRPATALTPCTGS
ncbi:MAG TPA: DUF2147 domain-containing protein [Acidocella sp.]|nr:DUF2147 domain-containing protein [Acidocella sp.]